MKLFYFDLETTGVNHWQHGIHQISGIIEIDGEVKEKFNLNVQPNPKARIEDEALTVANVTKEQILSYPPMQQVYTQLITILSKYVDKFNRKDKFFLVGYNNASFDNQFLRAFFVQCNDKYFGSWFWPNPIDVYVLASDKLIEQRTEMIDFKLKTVCSQLGIEVDESKLHDALYDVSLTMEVYKKIKL